MSMGCRPTRRRRRRRCSLRYHHCHLSQGRNRRHRRTSKNHCPILSYPDSPASSQRPFAARQPLPVTRRLRRRGHRWRAGRPRPASRRPQHAQRRASPAPPRLIPHPPAPGFTVPSFVDRRPISCRKTASSRRRGPSPLRPRQHQP
jgi:hypothetical protein